MAQQVKVLAAKPGSMSSIPGTHMVEERTDSQKLPSDLYMLLGYMCVYTHTINLRIDKMYFNWKQNAIWNTLAIECRIP